jgi:hypothetical protein
VSAEGLLTCCVALFFFFVISDFPEDVKWLTEEERQFVKARLQEDVGDSQRHRRLGIKEVLQTIVDRKYIPMLLHVSRSDKSLGIARVLMGGFMYFGLIVPAYSYGKSPWNRISLEYRL